jgi:hypothetical protein
MFLTDILGPMFGVMLGVAMVALLSDHAPEACGLLFVSLYIPTIALMNFALAYCTRDRSIAQFADFAEIAVSPHLARLVGIVLLSFATVLVWLMLPLQSPNTGC